MGGGPYGVVGWPFRNSIHGPARCPAPTESLYGKTYNREPVVKNVYQISENISFGVVGAASLGGPPSYATSPPYLFASPNEQFICTGRTRRRGTGLTSRPRVAGTLRRTVRSSFPHRATARWGPNAARQTNFCESYLIAVRAAAHGGPYNFWRRFFRYFVRPTPVPKKSPAKNAEKPHLCATCHIVFWIIKCYDMSNISP